MDVSERSARSKGATLGPGIVVLLARSVCPLAEVSRAVAQQRLTDAEAAYAARVQSNRDDVVGLDLAMARVQSARAMLDVASAA